MTNVLTRTYREFLTWLVTIVLFPQSLVAFSCLQEDRRSHCPHEPGYWLCNQTGDFWSCESTDDCGNQRRLLWL